MENVRDDPDLFATMVSDSATAGPLWQPTAYWKSYCRRIELALEHDGLADFRTNQTILKGFAVGGAPRPTLPRAAWKRWIWHAIERMPGTSVPINEYRRLLAASHRRAVIAEVRNARLLMDRLVELFPRLTPPEGLGVGGAEDSFSWRGHTVTADWVRQILRLVDFYRAVPANEVKAIVEIGPGLGLSTLAHIALNPALSLIVNCDIPPILYVSTQFLKSVPNIGVVDCSDVKPGDELVPGEPDHPTVYQLAPWQLPNVTFEADALFNAFSFQEMEPEVCRNYAEAVSSRVRRYVMLHSSLAGHQPGAGGQRQPVTMEFLKQEFGAGFPESIELGTFWADINDEDPATTVLLSRSSGPSA
jgi:putative sugar O-methyltransferase